VDVGEVGVPVAAPGGGPHRDEDGVRCRDGRREIGREGEPALRDVAAHQILEARLVDRRAPGLEGLDLRGVLVDAADLVAEIGEAGPGDEADIAGADHRDAHGGSIFLKRRASAGAIGRGTPGR
jgi:hypothetical protein